VKNSDAIEVESRKIREENPSLTNNGAVFRKALSRLWKAEENKEAYCKDDEPQSEDIFE